MLFHYLLKFLILMSFRGASPPRAPHRALSWTRWEPWRSPDPSPIQGAPTNVNSWIRTCFLGKLLYKVWKLAKGPLPVDNEQTTD